IINTPTRTGWQTDEGRMRSTAVRLGIPMVTTATAAAASVRAIEALRAGDWDVAALQDYREAAARPGVAMHGAAVPVPRERGGTLRRRTSDRGRGGARRAGLALRADAICVLAA